MDQIDKLYRDLRFIDNNKLNTERLCILIAGLRIHLKSDKIELLLYKRAYAFYKLKWSRDPSMEKFLYRIDTFISGKVDYYLSYPKEKLQKATFIILKELKIDLR